MVIGNRSQNSNYSSPGHTCNRPKMNVVSHQTKTCLNTLLDSALQSFGVIHQII